MTKDGLNGKGRGGIGTGAFTPVGRTRGGLHGGTCRFLMVSGKEGRSSLQAWFREASTGSLREDAHRAQVAIADLHGG